jgi:hypothetical protein
MESKKEKIKKISPEWILLIIVLLGFVLRIINALRLEVTADDMHFVTHAINIINSGILETYDQSAPLWFYITDFFYKLFGVTQLVSRLPSIIFGTLSILVMYSFSNYIFKDKKFALVASFLIATCPFAFSNMRAEMDVTVVFFLLSSVYMLYKGLKEDSNKIVYASFILLGLALLTKIYAVLFIGVNFLYIFYLNYKKNSLLKKSEIKKYLIYAGIILIFLLPTLSHNYILYNNEGILDLQFTRVLGLGKENSAEFYAWDAQFEKEFSVSELLFGKENIFVSLGFVFDLTPIIFILGIIGMFLLYEKKTKLFTLLSLGSIIPLLYLTTIILLPKHFLIVATLLVIPATYTLKRFIFKYGLNVLYFALLIILIFSFTQLEKPIFEKEPVGELMSFKQANFEENSLIVTDSRIYRGQTAWVFNDRSYIEGSNFVSALQQVSPEENLQSTKVYFIECATGDCGWGGIEKGGELDTLMNSVSNAFKQDGQLIKTISISRKNDNNLQKIDYFRIHVLNMDINRQIIDYAAQPKVWFMYPIGYDTSLGSWFDTLNPTTFLERLLYYVSRLIIFLSIFLALISPFYIIRNSKLTKK